MIVLRKDDDNWWFAKHEDGRTGSIPVPYVEIVSDREWRGTKGDNRTCSTPVPYVWGGEGEGAGGEEKMRTGQFNGTMHGN